jgi:hypothetical protein
MNAPVRKNYFLSLFAAGYTRLVPVLPCDAPVREKSSLNRPKSHGKAVGIRGRDGLWGGYDWVAAPDSDEHDLNRWHGMGADIGIKGGAGIVFIDADTKNEKHAALIEKHVGRLAPDLPKRIGQAPKAAYPVRVSGPYTYARIEFGDRNEKNQLTCRVEILGEGRYLKVHGIHPDTREPYTWPRPLRKFEELPIVSPESLDQLLHDLAEVLPAATALVREGGEVTVPQENLRGDPEHVAKLVRATPNTTAAFPTRESYVHFGYAIKASMPDDEPAAFALWEDWCRRWEDGTNDEKVLTSDWRRMKPPYKRGFDYLKRKASEVTEGAVNGATLHFDPEVVALQAAETTRKLQGVEPADIFGDADPVELSDPPPGSMPSILERWARDEARRKGVSIAFPAMAGLAAIGAAIGTSLKIRVRLYDEWVEPAALWVVLVADPGSAKSPIVKAAMAPLRRLDAEHYRLDQTRHDAWAANAKRLPKGVRPSEPEPKVRRCVVDDVTMERQIQIHAANPQGIMRAPDEFAGLLGSLGAYKKGAETDRSQILRMFDGDSITNDRVGSGRSEASSALMSVLAGTQPDKLRTLTRDLGADGVLQRCLFIQDGGQRRPPLDVPPDRVAAGAYEHTIRTLRTSGAWSGTTIELSREAYDVLMQATTEIEAMIDLPGASNEWKGHVRKWGKILPRLVLIFYAIEHMEIFEGELIGSKVERATAEKAVHFGRFVLRHSLRFYETYFGARAEASEARKIAGFILTKPDLTQITRRHVYDARTNLRGPDNLRTLLSGMRELEHAGWLEPTERDDQGPKAWRINPMVHARFADRAKREREERSLGRERIIRAASAKDWLTDDRPGEASA